MPRRPSAPVEPSTLPSGASGVADGPRDASVPTINGWDALAFKPLRDVLLIADPGERRAVALDRLESIQRLAANRTRPVGNTGLMTADPDTSGLIKAEEIVQKLLAIEPMKTEVRPGSVAAMAAFASPPKLVGVK